MVTLLLVRHGETDWNAAHRWQGFTGPSLNDLGRRQAAELAERLAATRIDAVYSSDSARAVETAEAVAARHGLPVRQDARLREVNFGEWEGLTRAEIDERYAGAFREWDACRLAAPTGGESDAEMARRVLEALAEIAAAHVGRRVVVVTSGGPIRAVQAHAEGLDQSRARLRFERPANCAVYEVEIEGRRLSIAASPAHSSPSK